MKVLCPKCNKEIKGELEWFDGIYIVCPNCKKHSFEQHLLIEG